MNRVIEIQSYLLQPFRRIVAWFLGSFRITTSAIGVPIRWS
jgi:hypothetical protein